MEEVEEFLKKFPDSLDFIVEKLVTKGTNCSFKIGADFDHKEKLLDHSTWPKNVAVKRFLFFRRRNLQTG